MRSVLVDTNVLLRWISLDDPGHPPAVAAVDALRDRGDEMYVTPQNLVEFWGVATRPHSANGFAMDGATARGELEKIEELFKLAPDLPSVYPAWRRLVAAGGVSGKQVHDARLAAVMIAHGISHILTFNTGDFERYPGVTAVHPAEVVPLP